VCSSPGLVLAPVRGTFERMEKGDHLCLVSTDPNLSKIALNINECLLGNHLVQMILIS
jgi:hypothetical protein